MSEASNTAGDRHYDVAAELILDEYEAVNLREALRFLRDLGGDTGDWFAQILSRLDYEYELKPNKDYITQKTELAKKVGWKVLFP